MVVQMWKSQKYKLFKNNCQHFADAMSDTLLNSPCNRPENSALRDKRQDSNAELAQYIDQQLRNCSLVCCYADDDSSAVARMQTLTAWVTVTFFTFVVITGFAL